MALIRSNRYPGRFTAPTTNNPQGAFKNRTTPTAEDGSYFEQDWANDWDGFFARILTVAGVTPNGTLDTGASSQLYSALLTAMPGRLIGTQRFTTNGTYTPTTGTSYVVVEVQGGGGGAGGIGAAGTSTVAVGNGGSGGGYNKAKITSGFSGVSVTVGTGGAGGNLSPTNGTSGGTSSFGSLIVSGGGGGGLAQAQVAPPFSITGTAGGNAGSGGTIITMTGGNSSHGFCLNTTSIGAGHGGSSFYGSGGFSGAVNGTVGTVGGGFGAGGGGGYAFNRSGFSGAAGSSGIVIIWEYA